MVRIHSELLWPSFQIGNIQFVASKSGQKPSFQVTQSSIQKLLNVDNLLFILPSDCGEKPSTSLGSSSAVSWDLARHSCCGHTSLGLCFHQWCSDFTGTLELLSLLTANKVNLQLLVFENHRKHRLLEFLSHCTFTLETHHQTYEGNYRTISFFLCLCIS